MSFGKWVLAFALTVPVFLAIDMVWLGFIARGLYREAIGHLMRASPNWPVAALFYLAYVAGILAFAVRPGLEAQSWLVALAWGALFGFFAYGTYDLTNLATLDGWPPRLAVIDITWGATLTGTVSAIGYFIARFVR